MGFQTGVGSAAGVVLPEDTLQQGSWGSARAQLGPIRTHQGSDGICCGSRESTSAHKWVLLGDGIHVRAESSPASILVTPQQVTLVGAGAVDEDHTCP